MHLLATSSVSLDDIAEPVDLRQPAADVAVLSFSDSDLAGIAAGWAAGLPSLGMTALRDLRHPMSVDLWLESTGGKAKVILVRILGGYDWWRYGCERLSEVARERGIALALLPGECRERDERLIAASTLPEAELDALLAYFREGGPQNMQALARKLSQLAGADITAESAKPLPRCGFYEPETGIVERETLAAQKPAAVILFYRSMLLAGDTAPIDALCDALAERGLPAAPLFVPGLKDKAAADFVAEAIQALAPAVILNATAFSSGDGDNGRNLFDRMDVPVFQIVTATTRREAWASGQRGLTPADLAMHVLLPELDGRILAGAISFKDSGDEPGAVQVNRPEQDRIEQVAERMSRFVRLQRKPRAERRVAILIPDYPNAPGRSGYAVGLDVLNSVLEMLHGLKSEGFLVEKTPETPRALLDMLEQGGEAITIESYRNFVAAMPQAASETIESAWGAPESDDALENGAFHFRAARFGNLTVALAPDRGRSADRRIDYHDPALPPRHALLAFGAWLQRSADAIVHVGAHGTLEWLPGKTVALSRDCFPEIVTGSLPVIYPFIVSNPGEAAQAKRRISAVTIGHLPPPLAEAGLDEQQQKLERLVDEYAQADGLDRRRRDRLAKLIVETARENGVAKDAGVEAADDPDAALLRIDAWLCDLKDFAIKDGLHIFGVSPDAESDPARRISADAERDALIAALDGRHIPAGPSGAPARGRTDVLPTGRNLFTADPRALPTPTAVDLGWMAAEEVLRRYRQDHGDWPRALVMDLWGSASLRTGGEEIAQGLALMGCRPQWDPATGRVTGIEVLPPALLGRPRVDVTWRISGLFRDMFPVQIALIDAAVAAIATRDEAAGDNPLAEQARAAGTTPARIFGSSPGTYGAGVEDLLASGRWQEREEIGQAYLDATSHAFGGADGEGRALPGAFARRLGEADLLIHAGDDPGRDLLEGSADVAFIGGFSAALKLLGGKADVIALDITDPARPRARSLSEAVTRVVRARAVNPRFIAGQMRHGPRGAAEFVETVDRLVGFAETTEAIPETLIGAVYDAYLGAEEVRDFILRENPAGARVMAERFASARRRGLWHPLRNAIDNDLAALIAEARTLELAA